MIVPEVLELTVPSLMSAFKSIPSEMLSELNSKHLYISVVVNDMKCRLALDDVKHSFRQTG